MRGAHITYWPAGGGRGQNPCRTGLAQGLDLCLKYGPRAPWSQFYTSLGRLYVPREVDLADKRGERSDPSLSARSTSLGTYSLPRDVLNSELSARVPYFKHRSSPWARPVRQGFCPRPPPAGQYVLYAPLAVYRISGMLYYCITATITKTPFFLVLTRKTLKNPEKYSEQLLFYCCCIHLLSFARNLRYCGF